MFQFVLIAGVSYNSIIDWVLWSPRLSVGEIGPIITGETRARWWMDAYMPLPIPHHLPVEILIF